MGIISIITSIISLIKMVMDLIGFIKQNQLQNWLKDLSDTVAAMKNAKTPEDKTNAAKSMVDVISRL